MKGPDDVTPAACTTRGDRGLAAHAGQEDPTQQRLPFVDLDSPLIGSPQGQITMCACTDFEDPDPPEEDDAFEDWACWPCPDEHLWAAYGHPVGDLRNPPKFIVDELSRPESC